MLGKYEKSFLKLQKETENELRKKNTRTYHFDGYKRCDRIWIETREGWNPGFLEIFQKNTET